MSITFSKRNGHMMTETPISVRDDAPGDVRYHMVGAAIELGIKPSELRDLVCSVLLKRPDQSNWSEYPNIFQEVHQLVDEAPWFRVYDIAEKIFHSLTNSDWDQGQQFQIRFNELLVACGVGLQMNEGIVVVRGTTDFQNTVGTALATLDNAGKNIALNEMHEAVQDISRRPNADISGAIQHAMAALECVARDLTGRSSDNLGQIIPELPLPKPLDTAVAKLWGFASQRGRHLSEETAPSFDEAMLVVSISGALSSYLIKVYNSQ